MCRNNLINRTGSTKECILKYYEMFFPKYWSWNRFNFIIISMLLETLANIDYFSTYRRMDLYHLESESPEQFCPDFVCEKSGLSAVRIQQILDKENEVRNDFAYAKSISNIFHVEWDVRLAVFARKKAQLCLYPTDENNVIFETRVINEWSETEKTIRFDKPVAIEVVIGQRIRSLNNTNALYLYDKMEDALSEYFQENNFNRRTALLRRGSVLQIGCDYLVQNNETHLMTYLVCAYGMLYFSNNITNDYSPIVGTPCSKCDFYATRSYLRSKNSAQKWSCYFAFAFLCGDLLLATQPVDDFRYQCNNFFNTTIPAADSFELITAGEMDEVPTEAVHKLPCLQYLIPVVVLIVITFVVILYQVYFIITLKFNLN